MESIELSLLKLIRSLKNTTSLSFRMMRTTKVSYESITLYESLVIGTGHWQASGVLLKISLVQSAQVLFPHCSCET